MGVKNCSFPLFVSEDVLQREKDHIEGFAAEVAWVTHAYGLWNSLMNSLMLTVCQRFFSTRAEDCHPSNIRDCYVPVLRQVDSKPP